MSKSHDFSPWKQADQIASWIDRFCDPADGRTVQIPKVGVAEGLGPIYDVTADSWTALDAHVVVEITDERLDRLVHGGERFGDVADIVLKVHCPRTNVRTAYVATLGPTERWEAVVRLERDELAGVVVIEPQCVRRAAWEGKPLPGTANEAGALLGSGVGIRCRIDAGANPFEGGLDVVWEDFASSRDSFRSERADLFFDVDVTSDPPKVFLNSRHVHAQALIDGGPPDDPAAAAARSALIAIAQVGITNTLFEAALAECTYDEETRTWTVPDTWVRQVIDAAVPDMYPDLPEAEREQVLLDDVSTASGRRAIARRWNAAVLSARLTPQVMKAIMSEGRS